MHELTQVKPTRFKPDMPETARRWEAFYHGDIIDRPVTLVWAKKEGFEGRKSYYTRHTERVLSEIDPMIDRLLQSAEANYYGGEAVPAFCPTMGPNEMAIFCGGELDWGDGKTDTNWSAPYVEDWESFLPFRLDEQHPLWQRLITLYRRCAERFQGDILLTPIDLHSNLDLLAAARGPQNLCFDLVDEPEMIDRAMVSARQVFREVWQKTMEAGQMEKHGFYQQVYSHAGAATLQCDFSVMISPDAFNRWAAPALEEEASLVKHAIYHWDGYDALRHFDTVMGIAGLQTISFIPGEGRGPSGRGLHVDFLDELKAMQKRGRAVHVWGTVDEVKHMHKELDPRLTVYNTSCPTQKEAEALLKWLKDHT